MTSSELAVLLSTRRRCLREEMRFLFGSVFRFHFHPLLSISTPATRHPTKAREIAFGG